MKLVGIGLDIVEVDRIKAAAKKKSHFLTRVFTDEEIRYCKLKKNRWQHLAVRFAAKEAVWKALGKRGVQLKNIAVSRATGGKPRVHISGGKRFPVVLEVSLSHSEKFAAAVALAFRR